MKLQMPKGCEDIGHGPNKYIVSNVDWTTEVPDHVGAIMLATSTGATRLDTDAEPEDFVCMVHPRNPLQPLTARGRVYHPHDGKIHVHAVAVADALRCGFVLAE